MLGVRGNDQKKHSIIEWIYLESIYLYVLITLAFCFTAGLWYLFGVRQGEIAIRKGEEAYRSRFGANYDNGLSCEAYEKQVYMTLYSPSDESAWSRGILDYYFEATRVLAYQLMHDKATKDLNGRRLVVLVTESVSTRQIWILEDLGCIVKSVPEILQPSQGRSTTERWKSLWTKLHSFGMGDDYCRICFIDSDVLLLKPLSSIFLTPVQNEQ